MPITVSIGDYLQDDEAKFGALAVGSVIGAGFMLLHAAERERTVASVITSS